MFTPWSCSYLQRCWYTQWLKGIPYVLIASQSGIVANRLEILFMVGGFQVICAHIGNG